MSTEVRTTCPYCGVGCGVLARAGAPVAGDPAHPANAGMLCSKGAALGETTGLDGRLLYPTILGRRVGWDAALDLVAARFAETIAAHGRDSVALYVSGQLLTEDYYAANKLAKAVFGTANIDSNSRLCMASAVAGHRRAFGEDLVPGVYEDLELADLVVLVGSNTAWCHPVLFRRIEAARARRPWMKLVVIDPRRTATCEGADMHLPLRPGSDVALFSGLLDHLGEGADIAATARLCGLDSAEIAAFFALFAATERVVTLFSQGVNQSSAGTDKVNAILNVHIATGRIGRPGAGPFSITGQPNAMGGREVGALATMLAAHLDWDRAGDHATLADYWGTDALPAGPGLKAVDLFAAIAARRVRAVWILGTNPAVSLPRAAAALEACDFVVVSDCAADTDTARLAHVCLPALAWGEKEGTVTNSERVISRQRAFLPAPGEARADWRAIAGVAARMGWAAGFGWTGPAEIFREHALLSGYRNLGARVFDISGLAEVDYDTMAPTRWPYPATGPGPARLTPVGRIVPTPYRAPDAAADAEFPLILLTGRIRDQWHMMTRTGGVPRLMAHTPEPELSVHPADTALAAGALVELRTAHGRAVLRLRHDAGMRRGSVFAPMHWTSALCPAARINAAVTHANDPVSGQPELKHTPASIAPFVAGWHGFALSRGRLAEDAAAWCAAIPEAGGVWRHEMAGPERPAEAFARIAGLLRLSGARFSDPAVGRYRAVAAGAEGLEACLFVERGPDLPGRAWLAAQFAAAGAPLAALLAGRLPGGEGVSPTVCVCHGVSAERIGRAIEAGCGDLAAVGAATLAGTGCGSCRPEIAALLAAAPVPA